MKNSVWIIVGLLAATSSFAKIYRGESLDVKAPVAENCSAKAFEKLVTLSSNAAPDTTSFREVNLSLDALNGALQTENKSPHYWYEMDFMLNGSKQTLRVAVQRDQATGECL